MFYFVAVHPTNPSRNEMIRVFHDDSDSEEERADANESARELFLLSGTAPGCVLIRAATDEEIKDLEDEEQDMEAGDLDVGFIWPDQSEKLSKLLDHWENPMSLQEILGIVVANSNGSCFTFNNAVDHIKRNYRERVEHRTVVALLEVLNYHALRENREKLMEIIK